MYIYAANATCADPRSENALWHCGTVKIFGTVALWHCGTVALCSFVFVAHCVCGRSCLGSLVLVVAFVVPKGRWVDGVA